MNEDLNMTTVSIGYRIVLTKEVCTRLNVDIGDKVVLYRNEGGEIAIRNVKSEVA